MDEALLMLQETGVVAVLRKVEPAVLPNLAAALVEGGVRCIEVTLNTPGALELISSLAADRRLLVGAGTVLGPGAAEAAALAGARLIVSPHFDPAVVAAARRAGVLAVPGAMTPTEILRAWEAGADLVKVFPAGSLGVNYFREIRAPLDRVRLMATGGVNAENAGEFVQAGVDVVGIGSALTQAALLAAGDWQAVAARARALVAAVAAARRVYIPRRFAPAEPSLREINGHCPPAAGAEP